MAIHGGNSDNSIYYFIDQIANLILYLLNHSILPPPWCLLMKKLDLMQKEFKEWLRKAEKQKYKEEIELKKLTEKKLIEIANKNDYELIDKNIDLGKDNIFLVFQNKNNKKFISAWVDEEGFATEELENL
ncbi:MAG: hypothetical protein ACFE96_10555 [Candidatus Hermodarchaeota archaeon]